LCLDTINNNSFINNLFAFLSIYTVGFTWKTSQYIIEDRDATNTLSEDVEVFRGNAKIIFG